MPSSLRSAVPPASPWGQGSAAAGSAPRARIAGVQVLREPDWRERERAHEARARALTAGHRERRAQGEAHPVEDFLWTYYSLKPSHLHRWHPGAGILLENAAADPGSPARRDWRFYGADGEGLYVDADALLGERGTTAGYIEGLLTATAARPARFGCFGL